MRDKLSFSSNIKDELAAVRLNSVEERGAALCALTHTAGAIRIGSRGVGVEYVSENPAVARLIGDLATGLFSVSCEYSIREQEGLKTKNSVVSVSGADSRRLLECFGCIPSDDDADFVPGTVPHRYTVGERIEKAFLRAAFLGAGSVTAPEKGYHLELISRNDAFAMTLKDMLEDFELNARLSTRKAYRIVYIKDGEHIADFLRLTGAVEGILEFENVRILRFTANDLNRRSNFEDANMHKAALASAQQLLDIELILKEAAFDSLPQKLREAAELRMNNPEATLSELAEEAGIAKSGFNHRMARIAAIAEDIRIHGASGEGRGGR